MHTDTVIEVSCECEHCVVETLTVSTEPGDQARSVTSPELVIPHGHLSHTRRSKSGYWSGTADIPDLRKRPQSSYHGSRQPFSTERQTVASADGMAPLEESVPVIKG